MVLMKLSRTIWCGADEHTPPPWVGGFNKSVFFETRSKEKFCVCERINKLELMNMIDSRCDYTPWVFN